MNEQVHRRKWVGAHPIERLGFALLAIGMAAALYWLVAHNQLGPYFWHDMRVSFKYGGRCLVGECSDEMSFAVAVRCLVPGFILRFLAMPVLRWLNAGSSSSS